MSKLGYHEDKHIGAVFNERLRWQQKTNAGGELYWYVEQDIHSLFGSHVNGVVSGFGRTKEQALQRLEEDKKNLSDSMWA